MVMHDPPTATIPEAYDYALSLLYAPSQGDNTSM